MGWKIINKNRCHPVSINILHTPMPSLSQGRKIIERTLKFFDVPGKIATRHIRRLNNKEFLQPPFSTFNERPVEYRFVFEQIQQFYPKTVLDIGTGVTALPHLMANCGCHVTAIDNVRDYWSHGMFNRHYHIIDDDIVHTSLSGTYDLITCISTLEHIEDFPKAVESMFSLLKSGGRLVLTFPYNEKEFIPNVYALPGSHVKKLPAYSTHAFSRSEIQNWTERYGARILKQEYWRFFTGPYWTVGERLLPPVQVGAENAHQISCIVFEKI